MKKILTYTVVPHLTLLLLLGGNTECSQKIEIKTGKKTTTTENLSQSFKPESYIMAMVNQNKKNLGLTEQSKTKIITGTLTRIAPKTVSKASRFDCSNIIDAIKKEAKELHKEQINQKRLEWLEIFKLINNGIDSLNVNAPCTLANGLLFYKPERKKDLATNFTRMLRALPFNINKKLLEQWEKEKKSFENQCYAITQMFKKKLEKYEEQLKKINDDTDDTDLDTPIFRKYLKTISTYLQVKPPEATYKNYKDNLVTFFTKYREHCFDQLGEQIIEKYYTFEDKTKNVFVKAVLNDQFKFKKN